MKRKAYIFDVDGTLANVDSILHYVVKHKNRDTDAFKKDFHSFHKESINVPPHPEVVDMAWDAIGQDYDIIVVTARKEEWRGHTSYWLAHVADLPHTALFMRPDKDNRPDYEVKKDILTKIQEHWDIVHAVDDNPNVIKLWQENGIETTKIGDWDGNH